MRQWNDKVQSAQLEGEKEQRCSSRKHDDTDPVQWARVASILCDREGPRCGKYMHKASNASTHATMEVSRDNGKEGAGRTVPLVSIALVKPLRAFLQEESTFFHDSTLYQKVLVVTW